MNENIETVFKLPKKHYKTNVDPVKHYLDISSTYLSKEFNIVEDKAKDFIKNYIKSNKRFSNPKVKFRERDIEGDITEKVTTLLDYIKYYRNSDNIMVPSGTVYFSPKKKKSLHAEFININVAKRSQHKKLAFKAKMEKDFEKFNYHNTLQKSMKIFNNSLSGAYASASTVLANPSAHYTLTSITRCVSGIGNAVSESVIAGNKHYRNPDVLFNYLATLINTMDKDKIKKIIDEYNLYLPTIDDIMSVLKYSYVKYWTSSKVERELRDFLAKLDQYERAYIVYHNDLYHLRQFNEEFMRHMMDEMVNYTDYNIPEDKIDYIIDNVPEWLYVLVIHLVADEVKGLKKDEFTLEHKRTIANFIVNTKNILLKYSDIFKAFLVTDVFPPNTAFIKYMMRESIVLSDTDSTCATYQNWVAWYLGDVKFNKQATAVSAVIMTIVSQIVEHYLKTFAVNMNLSYEAGSILEMKNEFHWPVFVNTNVAKHYFADVFIQEGNVFDLPALKTLERKGVHLIAPNAYGPIRELATSMMVDILKTVEANKKISLNKYIDQALEAEKIILDKLNQASPDVLKLEKIKSEDSYKLDRWHSPYLHYLLWQDVFADKYGTAPDPTYMAIKLPTIINSKREMKEWLDSHPDQEFAEKMFEFMNKAGKTEIKTFKPPLINVYTKGIPTELYDIIDRRRTVLDNCNVLYIVLETLGFYRKETMALREMILGEELS